MTKRQELLDRYYVKNGPCCAGCDWWRSLNSQVGECVKAAPVPGHLRYSMVGMQFVPMSLQPGHPLTPKSHFCGDFKDEFDWKSLPPAYLKTIGWAA